jgi:hypothetical protein
MIVHRRFAVKAETVYHALRSNREIFPVWSLTEPTVAQSEANMGIQIAFLVDISSNKIENIPRWHDDLILDRFESQFILFLDLVCQPKGNGSCRT